ncbi:ABC transporter permease [Micromonospora sp. NPDC048843]|uniref:ABC transporter permease n=1 Tax=Micromonospora sp. NPDC048843 TaxID=3155389 RepID=UPI0033EE5539
MSSVPVTSRPAPTGGRLAGAVLAEWTKLRSVRSTWWCVAGAAGSALLFVPIVGFTLGNNTEVPGNPPTVAVSEVAGMGAAVVQFVLGVLALLAFTSEYATGSIRPTLQAVPSRARLLVAKAVVVGVVTLLTGIVLGAMITGLAGFSLGDKGTPPEGGTIRMSLAIGLNFALVSLLALGIAVLVRRTAGALTIVFVVLMVVPATLDLLSLDDLAALLPARAGSQLVGGGTDPYGRVAGAFLLAAWAAAVNLAGYLQLRRRDA